MLNHKHIHKNKIEAMMLSRNKISFAIKFSTHSKDVSMTVKEERQKYTHNHSERYFKTGYSEDPMASRLDAQSETASNYSKSMMGSVQGSVQGSVITKQTGLSKAKGKKPKKIFNDHHLKVLPKYPKEYMRCSNLNDAIHELYDVQSDLCLTYFSQD